MLNIHCKNTSRTNQVKKLNNIIIRYNSYTKQIKVPIAM